jgi:hypothetical protein
MVEEKFWLTLNKLNMAAYNKRRTTNASGDVYKHIENLERRASRMT